MNFEQTVESNNYVQNTNIVFGVHLHYFLIIPFLKLKG